MDQQKSRSTLIERKEYIVIRIESLISIKIMIKRIQSIPITMSTRSKLEQLIILILVKVLKFKMISKMIVSMCLNWRLTKMFELNRIVPHHLYFHMKKRELHQDQTLVITISTWNLFLLLVRIPIPELMKFPVRITFILSNL